VSARLQVNEVGEQRLGPEDEALDRDVGLLVGVIDARDWNVAAALDDSGQNQPAEVVPDLGLDGEGAALVKQEVLGELLDVGAEPSVERVCDGKRAVVSSASLG
jgi:hypothetical protein